MNDKLNFTVYNSSDATELETLTLKLSFSKPTKLDDENRINHVIHRAFTTQLKNERQGTASTKTRSEVRGGGRKPWKQKGTGRARAGSNRSPLWKGGGVSFGPKPKNYKKKINRKEWQLALKALLLNKSENILIVNNLDLPNFKAKTFKEICQSLKINHLENIVCIVPEKNKNLLRSTSNFRKTTLLLANQLNIKDLVKAKHIIICKNSIDLIYQTYND